MTGITIFYGDNIIRYVVNTKKGLRPYFKQLPDNYQAKFELNLMSKFSNFIINKPFSAINNAARHIFSRYLLENKHLFYQYFKISNTGIDHLEQLINVNFFSSDRTSFCECIVFHKFFFLHRRRIAFCVEDHKTNNC
ncbi:DNA-binding transcriptional activator TdcR [Escherichia coli]|nr:DNA-binding transcriptional activator TdcR [Escherichia coli]EHV0271088.1 DNA-binding transcriptional activator TdcR [Escherichia coli]